MALATARARLGTGSLRFLLMGDVSSGISAWRDDLTVIGGTGSDTMTIYWSLTGTMTACATCSEVAAPSVSFSSLFTNQSVFSSGTSLYSTNTPGTISTSGSFVVPFTYGMTFAGGFRLSGSTGDAILLSGGSYAMLDFLDTGLITSIVLPAGASLLTGSGTQYPLAAQAVPEPATLLLFGTGVGAVVARRRRGKRG